MNKKSNLLTYLITLACGIALIVLNGREKLFDAIAILIGIVFLLLGAVSLIGALHLRKSEKQAGIRPNVPLIVVSAGALALGLLMVIIPTFFVHYLVYAIGVVLVLCGAIQLANLIPGMRTFGLSGFYLSAPVICILAGIVIMILGPAKILDFLAILAGIVMVVYSLNGLVATGVLSSKMHGNKTGEREVVNIE